MKDLNDILSTGIPSEKLDCIISIFGERDREIIETPHRESNGMDIVESEEEMEVGLLKESIGAIEKIEVEEILAPGVGKTDDPVRMYLKDMGLVRLSQNNSIESAEVL